VCVCVCVCVCVVCVCVCVCVCVYPPDGNLQKSQDSDSVGYQSKCALTCENDCCVCVCVCVCTYIYAGENDAADAPARSSAAKSTAHLKNLRTRMSV